jgi:hypothetical protein
MRNHLKKENSYDGTFVAFQSSIDALEVRQVPNSEFLFYKIRIFLDWNMP